MTALPRLPREEVLAHPPGPPRGQATVLGSSRKGREILGYRLGEGDLRVSLIGGCHADEPVGPAMLDRLTTFLAGQRGDSPWLRKITWSMVPHVNPDGDAVNAAWAEPEPSDGGYDLTRYLRHVVREAPGDDVEFGFPTGPEDDGARPENRAVADFLTAGGPFHLHGSFHGMAFASGPWFLIESSWAERSASMRHRLRTAVARLGYRVFDIDRRGEKGFWRIDEGFTTRPDSREMRRFFLERDDPETAGLFRPSSMETVRALGGDPFTLVSEMPLFLYDPASGERRPDHPSTPAGARRFTAWAHQRLREGGDDEVRQAAAELGLRPMPVQDQMRLQLSFLDEALQLVAAEAAQSGA